MDTINIVPGELIGGRYRVEELIAKGGQASVWRARQEPLERPVALKVLTPPPVLEDGEPFQERFLLEAKTLASLTHPNIVVVYDYGEVRDGHYYIAMEYIEGVRFSEILRQRPRNIRRMLRLIFQICKALRYAHNRGVIHRDVKNANILVHHSEEGEELVKVVDFGIVKLQEADSRITQEGVILGSPHFMSPEQIRGEAFDHRADIYSVGVLLFCAAVGRYPFRGKTPYEIMRAHLANPLPPLKINDELLRDDPKFHAIIHQVLAKDPNERYQFMDELIEALQPYTELSDLPQELLLAAEEKTRKQPHAKNNADDMTDQATVQADMGLHPFHDNMATNQLAAIADDMAAEIVDEPDEAGEQDRDEQGSERDEPEPMAAAIALQPISAQGLPPAPPQMLSDDSGQYTLTDDATTQSPSGAMGWGLEDDEEHATALSAALSNEPDGPSHEEPVHASDTAEEEPQEEARPEAESLPTAARPSSPAVFVIDDDPTPQSRLLMLWGLAFGGTLILLVVVAYASDLL
jgi:serine/threonine protein kinase